MNLFFPALLRDPIPMLPYPTDRRRLLMMVRVFLNEFSEFVPAYGEDLSPADLPGADRQLEGFLERLAMDASQIDAGAERLETEAGILRGIERHLAELVQHAASHCSRIRWN